jgi:uncharacterized protein YukE
MNNQKLTGLITRLELGLAMNPESLKALADDTAAVLKDIRDFGGNQATSSEWQRLWSQQAAALEAALVEIRRNVNEMDAAIESPDRNRGDDAIATRESIQTADRKLRQSLDALRAQTSELDAESQAGWQRLHIALETHLKTMEACVETTQIKMEMLKAHSKEDVELAFENILSRLPDISGTSAESADEKRKNLDAVAIELHDEQHRYIGLMGIIKALFMWVETPAERVRKNEA